MRYALRRGALNWFAEALLGLLVIAFAVWGVGDMVRQYGQGTLATIGKTQITIEEYRQAYQDELAALSRRFGRRLTPEQAKLFGIEQRALSRLIGAAALDSHVRDLHVALSDQAIADIIRDDPAFRGVDGRFSKAVFEGLLRQNGLSEGRYVHMRRQEEARDQVTDTLLSGVAPPQVLIDAIHRYQEETRVIAHFTPDFDKLVKAAEPDDAKLREFYEQNKRRFMSAEQRKINLLLLTRATAKSRATVSDDAVKAAYDEDTEKYNIPEKRHIEQLPFQDMAAAEKAYAELAKAKDFKEAAVKLGFKESDFDLGMLARRDMIDAKVADAAFSLKKGELSKPVEGQFAIVLVRVREIEPAKQRTFEEVKAEIRDRLADERATHEIQTLHDQVENERYAGKSLKEIGDGLKLPFHEIAAVERSGKIAELQIDEADASRVAQAAFAGSVGVEAEAAELADGGYAWVDVLAVTPEKQKPYEDVTAEVKKEFMEQERRQEISARTAKLVERLKQGEALESVAQEVGAKVEKTAPITRRTSPQGLTQNAVQQAFALSKDGAASAATADGKGRTIFRVLEIIPAPPPTPEQTERLKVELSQQLRGDILSEYIAGLQTRYGLTVNQEAVRQALGVERE